MNSSDIVRKVAGTYIADTPVTGKPVIAWLQKECRSGSLSEFVEAFVRNQPEPLDAALLIVDSIEQDGIQCHIPCRLDDHESASTFLSSVALRVNPVTGDVSRLAELV